MSHSLLHIRSLNLAGSTTLTLCAVNVFSSGVEIEQRASSLQPTHRLRPSLSKGWPLSLFACPEPPFDRCYYHNKSETKPDSIIQHQDTKLAGPSGRSKLRISRRLSSHCTKTPSSMSSATTSARLGLLDLV